MDNNRELWKTIEHNPYLQISSKGRIKRLAHGQLKQDKIQSDFWKDKDGYCKVNIKLTKDATRYSQVFVHRLVAKAFLPNPDNKTLVNHKDSNRTNNCIENLEWVTPRENVLHSFTHGQRKICKKVPTNTILTDYQISQIDNLRQYYTVNQISKLFNIKYQSLKNIIHKKKQSEILDNQQPSNYKLIYN